MDLQDRQTAECFICQKHREKITIPGGAIYEDHVVYAGHIRAGQWLTYLGYLMAELKSHDSGLAGQTNEEA